MLVAQLFANLGAISLSVGITSSIHHHWTDGSETTLTVVGAVILIIALPLHAVMWWRTRRPRDRTEQARPPV
jgi:hypothetical protein